MRVKHLIQLLLSFVYFAAGIISFFPPLTLVAAALFLVGAAVFFLIDAQKIHNAVSGLIYNCRSTPKKRWVEPNPLTKRAVTTQLDSANVGNQWHLSKLKMKVNEAFDEIKQLHLNVMDKDGQASSVDRVKNFGHLCQHLKLNGEFVLDQFLKKKKIIDFADLFDKEESVDSSQLTYEQIRSLRVLDALQAAILQAKAELAKKNLEQPNELLELLGLKEMLGEVDLTFNEDPALPAAKMEIKEAVILGTV